MVFDAKKSINKMLGKSDDNFIDKTYPKEPIKKTWINKYPKIIYTAHDWIGIKFGNVYYELELNNDLFHEPEKHKEELLKIKKMTFITIEKKYNIDYCGLKKPDW